MLEVVTFKWKSPANYKSKFMAEHVNVLSSMVKRHCRLPLRFSVVTDDPAGIDQDIRVIPLWGDLAEVRSPMSMSTASFPSCYRRLKVFSAEARELIGERIVCLDLDVVITGDVTPLWDRPEDFVIWGDTARNTPYNGSMILMTAGSRRRVWDEFDPVRSPQITRRMGYVGSDQAWIGACLGKGEVRWGKADGVYSFRNDLQERNVRRLPEGARVVVFHGRHDPWHADVQTRFPWIKDYYR